MRTWVFVSFIPGICAFSAVTYSHVHHELYFASASVPIIVAMLLALAAILCADRGTTAGPRSAQQLRGAIAALAAAIGCGQLYFRWTDPWLLYAWIACWPALAWVTCPLPEGVLGRRRAHWPVLAFAVAVICAVHVVMQIDLWRSMSFGYHDIGLYARALTSAVAGRGLWVDSLGRSLLGEHTFFAIWLFVPVIRTGIDPLFFLMAASALALNGSALIVAWFGQRKSGSRGVGLVAGIAWLLLPMSGCLVVAHGYGFHEMYFAVPMLALGLALGEVGRIRAASIVMLASLAVREDLALTIAAWGLYLAIVKRRPIAGCGVVAISAVYLAAAIWWIVPFFRGEAYPHLAFHFGDLVGRAGSLRALSANASFVVTLLLPMAFLPLLNWRLGLVAVPAIAETLLTTNRELHNIGFQYYTPALPVLFIAAMGTLLQKSAAPVAEQADTKRRSPGFPARLEPRRVSMLLTAGFVTHVYLGFGPLSNNPATPTAHESLQAALPAVERIRATIPRTASVTASYRIGSHFLNADRLWTVANDELGDVIVVHDADVIDEHLPRTALVRAQRAGGYQPFHADYHLVALVRQDEPTALAGKLRILSRPADIPMVGVPLGDGILLDAMRVEDGEPASQLRVVLLWRKDPKAPMIETDRRFGLVCGDMRWGPFYFARGAYPTNAWKGDVLYVDEILIDAPRGQPIRIDDLRVVLLE